MAQIKPTVPQYRHLMSTSAFPAFVAGFGAGKTEAAVLRSAIGLLSNPGSNRGFYEPTYDLIRMIAWPRFEQIFTQLGVPYRLAKSPVNQIEVPGYGNIIFRSMDNPHRIVGYEHGDADIDELDTLPPDDAAQVWRQVLARNRQKKANGSKNTIGVSTTPEGFRFVYEMWGKQQNQDYELITAATYSNPYLPDGYIKSLEDAYPPQLLKAYLEGQFVNLTSGTVYASFSRSAHDSNEEVRKGEAILVGCDFNVTKQCAVVYVRRNGEQFHAVEEFVDMYDTPEMIRILKERFPDNKITVYPDASGAARKTVNASISDIALLEQAGFEIRANKTNPRVRDRVNATNSAFSHGKLYVNTRKCSTLSAAFEQLAYDKNGEPDKKSGKDHITDAGTYPVAFEMPILKPIAHIPIKFSM